MIRSRIATNCRGCPDLRLLKLRSADTKTCMLPPCTHGIARLALAFTLLLSGGRAHAYQNTPEPETPEPESSGAPVTDSEQDSGQNPGQNPGQDENSAPDGNAPAPAEAEAATEPVEEVDPWRGLTPYEPGYRGHAEVVALVQSWIEGSEGRLRSIELPPTRGGLTVPAFEWGTAGALPMAERPTLILLGGLDGVSFAGGEAVLKAASGLIQRTSDLPEDLAFVAIPWASPDGLQRAYQGLNFTGVNTGRTDEDGDEVPDEDGPDDLDGDGVLLDMLIEDAKGPWTRASDPRFLARARAGDAPRYRLVREGADSDGDGRFNEDDVGGVNLDRNFPVGWRSEGRGGSTGTWPLSENVARALADLALARRTACVILFQGNHGSVGYPGGLVEPYWPEDADRPCWEWAATELSKATGGQGILPRTLRDAHSGQRAGAAVDWLYVACGIPAMEVALWGPNIASRAAELTPGGTEPLDAQFRTEPSETATSMGPVVSSVDRAWARWLDNQRGGVGFTEWYPVDVGGGETVLLGGWAPRTRLNPPDDELPRVLEGVDRFVEGLVRGFPRLEISLDESRREGSILHMSARVGNVGELATGMWTEAGGVFEGGGVQLELALPAGARILAGTGQVSLGTLAGGSKSRVVEWIVLAPPGSVVRLEATSAWTLPSKLEVRP